MNWENTRFAVTLWCRVFFAGETIAGATLDDDPFGATEPWPLEDHRPYGRLWSTDMVRLCRTCRFMYLRLGSLSKKWMKYIEISGISSFTQTHTHTRSSWVLVEDCHTKYMSPNSLYQWITSPHFLYPCAICWTCSLQPHILSGSWQGVAWSGYAQSHCLQKLL